MKVSYECVSTSGQSLLHQDIMMEQYGIDANGRYCYSSINELEEIRVNKGIVLLSCNGATPTSDYMTAIGMLSSKVGGVPTIGSAYASVSYQ